jgi:uncharacterized protein YabN with tetrapyrrole methylase and pyrophosphatase domain
MAKKLKQIREMFEEYDFEAMDKEDLTMLKELRLEMGEIIDSRDSAYVRHELGDIILTTLFAVMAGANEWLEIEAFAKAHEKWLRRFLAMENGVPSDDTFRLVISSLNLNYERKYTHLTEKQAKVAAAKTLPYPDVRRCIHCRHIPRITAFALGKHS